MNDFDPEFDKLTDLPPIALEVPHADLIARLREWQRDARTPIQRQDARDAADALAALGDTVPRAEMTVDQFREAVGVERATHAARGYDEGHDRAHGVPHLLTWAIDYASRGEAVKSGALIVAALNLAQAREREEQGIRAERDALAHVVDQVREEAKNDAGYSSSDVLARIDRVLAKTPAPYPQLVREQFTNDYSYWLATGKPEAK